MRTYFSKIKTFYTHFDIEIPPLPETKYHKTYQTSYLDLPGKEHIRKACDTSTLDMKAIILFMSSSGTSKSETLSITIDQFIQSTSTYHNGGSIKHILKTLSAKKKHHTHILPKKKQNRQILLHILQHRSNTTHNQIPPNQKKPKTKRQTIRFHPNNTITQIPRNQRQNELGIQRKIPILPLTHTQKIPRIQHRTTRRIHRRTTRTKQKPNTRNLHQNQPRQTKKNLHPSNEQHNNIQQQTKNNKPGIHHRNQHIPSRKRIHNTITSYLMMI